MAWAIEMRMPRAREGLRRALADRADSPCARKSWSSEHLSTPARSPRCGVVFRSECAALLEERRSVDPIGKNPDIGARHAAVLEMTLPAIDHTRQGVAGSPR